MFSSFSLFFSSCSLLGTCLPGEKVLIVARSLKDLQKKWALLFSLFIHFLSFCPNKHFCILKSIASVYCTHHRLTSIKPSLNLLVALIGNWKIQATFLYPSWNCLKNCVPRVNECQLVFFSLLASRQLHQWLNLP